MKNLMAPNIPLALVLLAAVAAVALRAMTRRPEAPGTAPAPVTVRAGQRQSRPQPAVATNAVDQAQHIFHELHADGRHTSCTVCDSHYRAT